MSYIGKTYTVNPNNFGDFETFNVLLSNYSSINSPTTITSKDGGHFYTPLHYPETMTDWIQVSVDADGDVSFLLNDGAQDFFYDGSGWIVAGPSDSNSLSEVNANIASFPGIKIRVKCILASGSKVGQISIIHENMTPEHDVYISSVMDYLKGIRPEKVTKLSGVSGDSIVLEFLSPNIKVRKVFKVENGRRTDVFFSQSNNGNEYTINFSEVLDDATINLVFSYGLDCRVSTDQDFFEVDDNMSPMVVIERMTPTNIMRDRDTQHYKGNEFKSFYSAYCYDLVFDCKLLYSGSNSAKDILWMKSAIEKELESNSVVKIPEYDTEYQVLSTSKDIGSRVNSNIDNLSTTEISFKLCGVSFNGSPVISTITSEMNFQVKGI